MSSIQIRKLPLLLVLLASLIFSFAAVAPVAHASTGGNQVKVESVTLSSDQTSLIIVVSATVNDPTVTLVVFQLSVSYGDHHLNINKVGMVVATVDSNGTVVGDTATAVFSVPFQGAGYYLVQVDAYNALNGTWLGGDWVDPREGTTG